MALNLIIPEERGKTLASLLCVQGYIMDGRQHDEAMCPITSLKVLG